MSGLVSIMTFSSRREAQALGRETGTDQPAGLWRIRIADGQANEKSRPHWGPGFFVGLGDRPKCPASSG
jgi:hypothetical protein